MGIQRKVRNPKVFPTGPFVHQERDIETVTTDLANITAADVAFTPSGSLSDTNVQAAIESLDALIGGGIISGGGTFDLDGGDASGASTSFDFDGGGA